MSKKQGPFGVMKFQPHESSINVDNVGSLVTVDLVTLAISSSSTSAEAVDVQEIYMILKDASYLSIPNQSIQEESNIYHLFIWTYVCYKMHSGKTEDYTRPKSKLKYFIYIYIDYLTIIICLWSNITTFEFELNPSIRCDLACNFSYINFSSYYTTS